MSLPIRKARSPLPPSDGASRGVVEDLRRVTGDDPVVSQGDRAGPAAREAVQGRERKREVEVGRWRGRPENSDVGQADADRIAAEEQAARRVDEAEVVLRVPGAVDGL